MKIGWVGLGRMGVPMVNRLLDAKLPLAVWNRTREKATPFVARGANVVEAIADLRDVDAVFTMLPTGKELASVCFDDDGLAPLSDAKRPRIVVDCSTIGVEDSREIRERLSVRRVQYLAAPVSGNPRCVAAGKLSSVVSGPEDAFNALKSTIEIYASAGAAYVGEGELARICKVAHNVLLGTTMANLIEVTLLAQKAGVPRHAFLQFINSSVMGSIFTRYKSPALVNLDWATTLTTALMLKDLDLGLQSARSLGVSVPITAAVREAFQGHVGTSAATPGGEKLLAADFAALFESSARAAGLVPESENVTVPTGLE